MLSGLSRSDQNQSTGRPAAHALARYRCFLPDLAGLAGLRRAGPGPTILTLSPHYGSPHDHAFCFEPGNNSMTI